MGEGEGEATKICAGHKAAKMKYIHVNQNGRAILCEITILICTLSVAHICSRNFLCSFFHLVLQNSKREEYEVCFPKITYM